MGTVIGTLVAAAVVPLGLSAGNGWKIASALAARHIGGAVNYVAVRKKKTDPAKSRVLRFLPIPLSKYEAHLFQRYPRYRYLVDDKVSKGMGKPLRGETHTALLE